MCENVWFGTCACAGNACYNLVNNAMAVVPLNGAQCWLCGVHYGGVMRVACELLENGGLECGFVV